MTTADGSLKATRRDWLALAVLCLPTLLATVDINVVILALPRIATDLHASATEQLWISDIYAFMIAGFLITMGTLGDKIGRRKVLLIGAAAFIAASLFAAFSTSAPMLIAARALIGVAGATVMPSVLALIRNMFKDPKEMGAAMGVWGMSIMLGLMLGPVVGGLLLGAFWWGSVFLIAVPIMGLLLVFGPALLPESRDPNAGRLDLVSVALSLAVILPLVYGVKELGANGWHPLPIVAVVAGAVFAVVFVQRQRKLASPLLDLSLFKSRAMSATCLLALFMSLVLAGTGLEITLFLQAVKGLTPLHVGLLLLIPVFVMLIASNLAPAIARKVRPGYVIAAASVIAVGGMIVILQQSATAGVTDLIIGVTIVFICSGSIGPLSGFLIMTSAPPEKAGSAGALSSTAGELGLALGVALLGVVGTLVYRTKVTIPAGIPAHSASAAHQSIVGAVTTARQLPGQTGAALLHSADAAFVTGLHVVAVVGAVVFACMAILAAVGLRQVPAMGEFPGFPGQPQGDATQDAKISQSVD
jgi:MFS transporter, DHA2 family, multidrug resistance protein